MNGIVSWFNNVMKYGFIEGEDKLQYFVHFTDIQADGYKTLKKNQLVTFTPEQSMKGFRARKVVAIHANKRQVEVS